MAAWEFRHGAGKGVIGLSGSWLVRFGQAPMPEVGRLCKRAAGTAGLALDDAALPESAKQLLRLLPSRAPRPASAPQPPLPFLARLGTRSIELLAAAGASATLAVAVPVGCGRLLLGRAQVRAVDFVADLLDAGPRAWGVVCVVNFLIGAVLAYIGAAELRPFGAENYVPSLTAVASVREISSVMTAIVMAGRTGGAYAARIASMKENDEIAALQTAGIPHNDFVLLPAITSLRPGAPSEPTRPLIPRDFHWPSCAVGQMQRWSTSTDSPPPAKVSSRDGARVCTRCSFPRMTRSSRHADVGRLETALFDHLADAIRVPGSQFRLHE